MAETVKETVQQAVEGVKNLAVGGDTKPKKEKKQKKGAEGGDARPQGPKTPPLRPKT